jgi:hypothetical protein
MTKKLSELFDLPDFTDDVTPEQAVYAAQHALPATDDIDRTRELISEAAAAMDKIDAALPGVKNLDYGDGELDELADFAKRHADDLLALGMNMDPRFSGPVFQTASVMIGHAITAKTAKLDKKLKMIQLQLTKAKLDHQIAKDNKSPVGDSATAITGQATVVDRNELLLQIIEMNKMNKMNK